MNAFRHEHVRAVEKGGARPRDTQTTRNRGQMSGKRPCNRCGKDNHTTSECTIPRSVKYSKCKKLGHIGHACRGGKPWQPSPTGKQATQGRACQVAPNETDDATPAGSESRKTQPLACVLRMTITGGPASHTRAGYAGHRCDGLPACVSHRATT